MTVPSIDRGPLLLYKEASKAVEKEGERRTRCPAGEERTALALGSGSIAELALRPHTSLTCVFLG